ncbi:MAG TPA: hypothetical protein VLZ74_12815 [Methylocella sp.]|nr:hypothetical protein [Methylocella sp.]
MQLGTGIVDFLPGANYRGQFDQWSWGAVYRGRLALDNNSEGYHYGYQHELSGWGGYTWIPGVTTTYPQSPNCTIYRLFKLGADWRC